MRGVMFRLIPPLRLIPLGLGAHIMSKTCGATLPCGFPTRMRHDLTSEIAKRGSAAFGMRAGNEDWYCS